jgi:hypothetical protein
VALETHALTRFAFVLHVRFAGKRMPVIEPVTRMHGAGREIERKGLHALRGLPAQTIHFAMSV